MLSLLLTTSLVCGFAGGASQNDAATELSGLAENLAKVESYQFTWASESSGGGRGGQGRGGDAVGDQQSQVIHGQWTSGQPMQLKVGDAVAFKDGEKVVYADAEGKWTLFEMPAMGEGRGAGGRGGQGAGRGDGGGQGGQRGRRGQGGDGEGGDRPARTDGPDRGAMRAMRPMMGVTAPHEEFQSFAALVSDVEKSTVPAGPVSEGQDGAKATPAKTVYTGKLTEAGVEALGGGAGPGRRSGAGGGPGRGEMEMTTAGTFTVEVVDGAIASAEFAITRSGSFGDRKFERTTKRALTFSDAGKAKFEVPADALALFGN